MADWQSIAALLCVAAAAVYLAWQAFRRATKRSGCGGCGTCPANTTNKSAGLISLDPKIGNTTAHHNSQR